jgi:hypothetical protein
VKNKELPSVEALASQESMDKLTQSLNEEPDMICVLVVGAYLDRYLAAMLGRHLRSGSTAENLLSHKGVLGSFQARVDVCYCLGLIEKYEKQNLDTIGQIRNTFGHSHTSLGFDDPAVAELCGKLTLPLNPKGPYPKTIRPRGKLLVVAMFLITRLQGADFTIHFERPESSSSEQSSS